MIHETESDLDAMIAVQRLNPPAWWDRSDVELEHVADGRTIAVYIAAIRLHRTGAIVNAANIAELIGCDEWQAEECIERLRENELLRLVPTHRE